MPRHVYRGRRGGRPKLAQAGGGLDIRRLNHELAAKAANEARGQDQDEAAETAALVATEPASRENSGSPSVRTAGE
jgi:hypothetical protein